MPLGIMILALGVAAAAPPELATGDYRATTASAPAGAADTRYCMNIEAVTGSRLEQIVCWTRAEWSDQGVDVDHDWAEDGVRTIG